MDTATFDGIVRHMGEGSSSTSTSSRRSFFRVLGGAAALGAGLVTVEGSLAKGHNRGRAAERGGNSGEVSAQGRGGKKITICYQGQTRTIKKSKLGNYPGATRGACPTGGSGTGNGGTGNGGTGGGTQPIVCSRWILSGGPNQTDKIVADDDLGIYNLSQGGAGIINDFDRKATWVSPVVFDAKVGDKLNIVGYDAGGCRSLSQIWLHCQATGQKRQVFGGYSGANCNYSAGTFVNQNFEVWM